MVSKNVDPRACENNALGDTSQEENQLLIREDPCTTAWGLQVPRLISAVVMCISRFSGGSFYFNYPTFVSSLYLRMEIGATNLSF